MCISGEALDGSELIRLALDLDATDRRLLSNSFNAAGNWSPSWVLDSGPLFWFVGPGLPDERDLTDLSRFMPDLSSLPAEEREAWQRLIAERARFRRAIGEPAAALEAMPLSPESYRGMHTRLQLATNARPSAGPESELPPLPSRLPEDPRVLWAAEGGDLLYAHGERERAAELLAESAAGGWARRGRSRATNDRRDGEGRRHTCGRDRDGAVAARTPPHRGRQALARRPRRQQRSRGRAHGATASSEHASTRPSADAAASGSDRTGSSGYAWYVAKKASPTLAVLREIRDEARKTNARLDETNTRLDETNTRLDEISTRIDGTSTRVDETNTRLDEISTRIDGTSTRVERVERRQRESEVRLATEIVAVAQAVIEVRDLLRDRLDVRERVDDHERRIAALERD
jgi:hypothetical protein